MRLSNIYYPSLSSKGQSAYSANFFAGVATCILFALVFANPALAQTSVSRTTSILAGASPFQDSLWTFNVSNYSVRTRLAPTITAGPITGTVTGINGLATHPVTKVHYALLKVTGQSNRVLATINLQTGFCTTIGSLGDKFSTIAFNANGSLFGVTGNGATVPETMYRINSATAAKTLFRSLGSGADGEIIMYNTDNNYFYHWSGNSVVFWERFDTSGTDVIQSLSYTGTPGGETFGSLYLGGGNILVSNISSQFRIWDTLGNISAPVSATLPDDIRGIIRQTITSTISAGGPTTICSGTSVVLSVAGASGGYQWYRNGAAISAATSSTYSASTSGIYNCIYTDINGFTDSTASGIPVTVKQTPSLTSGTTPTAKCNNTLFTYTATSSVTIGTTFAWSRPVISGISNPASTGVATISETLTNTTPDPIGVAYTFTLTANGCTNIETVSLAVNPTPTLFPPPSLVPSFCSGGTYTFTQNSLTSGTTYSWTRLAIAGISSPASSGTGNISNPLTNTTPNPITVTYADTLTINGCKNTEFLSVIVKPVPVLTSTLTPSSICDNGVFDYNPTSATSSVSYTWTRPVLPTVGNSFGSGNDTINERLDNITANPVTVTYPITLTANGCSNTQNVNVLVYPTPTLNTTLTPAARCDSSRFLYVPNSNTTGVSYTWSRIGTVGIKNPVTSGTDTISEWLKDTVGYAVPVTYVYTLTIGACSNTQSVVVVINPTPVLSNTPIPATPICDSTLFSFQPTSITSGTAYAWHRDYVEGISALTQDGTGNPNEILDNTTNTNLTVAYVYTLTANGCSHVQSVPVLVRPTPTFTSRPTDSACSGIPFTYQPLTGTIPASSVTYAWSRIPSNGITPLIAGGNGNISETLVNATTNPLNVTYVYTLSIGTTGSICTNTGKLVVKVRPSATAPVIATMPPAALCNGTMYQNFGAATLPPAGQAYTWSASNASIQASGIDGQYALVNFTSTGIATVTVTSKIAATGCIGSSNYYVTVTGNTAQTPYVIYNSGKFVCLQNDVKSFQWGYDDATTLDSVLLVGETGQSYFNTAATATFGSRHYWVITTTTDNCMQKTYYDKAPGSKIITDDNTGFAEMKIFPNPASDNINVEINTTATGNITIELANMVGQSVNTITTTNHNSGINISNLPAGMYMVNSYLNGNKVGTAKFVKN